MKTVFRSNEIAHVWFHANAPHDPSMWRNRPHGRSPGSMSFDGDVFLSYNTAIARKVTHKGKCAVILNDRDFSNTTTAHKHHMRGAIPQDTVRFHFDGGMGTRLEVSPKQLFDYAIERAADFLTLSKKPRIRQATRDGYLASRQTWLAEAQKVSDFFGLRRKVDEKSDVRLAKRIATAQKAEQKRIAERQKQAEEREKEALAEWLRGEHNDTYRLMNSPVMLRLNDGHVETTKGIRITELEAKLAFRFIAKHRATGWKSNGHKHTVNTVSGEFQLDSINEFGIVAGCHRISWDEINRFAMLMGWTNETGVAP